MKSGTNLYSIKYYNIYYSNFDARLKLIGKNNPREVDATAVLMNNNSICLHMVHPVLPMALAPPKLQYCLLNFQYNFD